MQGRQNSQATRERRWRLMNWTGFFWNNTRFLGHIWQAEPTNHLSLSTGGYKNVVATCKNSRSQLIPVRNSKSVTETSKLADPAMQDALPHCRSPKKDDKQKTRKDECLPLRGINWFWCFGQSFDVSIREQCRFYYVARSRYQNSGYLARHK